MSVSGRIGRNMSIHDVCTLHAGGCGVVSLVGIPIGVHGPHSARLGAVVRYSVTNRYTIAHYGTVSPSFLPSALYHPLTSVYSLFVSILPYIWCISTLYSVLPFGSHISSLWSAIVLVSVVFPLVPYVPPYTVY